MLSAFENDYPTLNGIGVRDYIHVIDLVDGPWRNWITKYGANIWNLGSGVGYSALQMVEATEKITGNIK